MFNEVLEQEIVSESIISEEHHMEESNEECPIIRGNFQQPKVQTFGGNLGLGMAQD